MSTATILAQYAEEYEQQCPFRVVAQFDGNQYYKNYPMGFDVANQTDIGKLAEGKFILRLTRKQLEEAELARVKPGLFQTTTICIAKCLFKLATKNKPPTTSATIEDSDKFLDLFMGLPDVALSSSRMLCDASWFSQIFRKLPREDFWPVSKEDYREYMRLRSYQGAGIIGVPRKAVPGVLTFTYENSLVVTRPEYTQTDQGIAINFGYDLEYPETISTFKID